MNTISLLAPYFECYITINGIVPDKTYNYVTATRNFRSQQVVDVTLHRSKCGNGSWLYIAIRQGSELTALQTEEKLYVGSQTSDRMFRGDDMKGRNFHHAQMRSGNRNQNLISYLQAGGKVDIYRISAHGLEEAVACVGELQIFVPLLRQPSKHVGYWFEQVILLQEVENWIWNTNGAESKVRPIINRLFDVDSMPRNKYV